jgi:hypothetical protein
MFAKPSTTDWAREGATPEEAGQDLEACHHAAQKRVDIDLQADQDMGVDSTSQGGLATNLSEYEAGKRVNTMTHDCMVALGYAPAGNTAP